MSEKPTEQMTDRELEEFISDLAEETREPLNDPDLEDDDDDEDAVDVKAATWDHFSSQADGGQWTDVELFYKDHSGKRFRLVFEMLLYPFEGQEVQDRFIELQEHVLSRFPALRRKLERARKKKKGMPMEWVRHQTAIRRQVICERVIRAWRGKDGSSEPLRGLPYSPKNAQELLRKCPRLMTDVINATAGEESYLALRQESASGNLPPSSSES